MSMPFGILHQYAVAPQMPSNALLFDCLMFPAAIQRVCEPLLSCAYWTMVLLHSLHGALLDLRLQHNIRHVLVHVRCAAGQTGHPLNLDGFKCESAAPDVCIGVLTDTALAAVFVHIKSGIYIIVALHRGASPGNPHRVLAAAALFLGTENECARVLYSLSMLLKFGGQQLRGR